MSLTTEERERYTRIIDEVLGAADLSTISSKMIRKELQAKVEEDVLLKKAEVSTLIIERFDHAQATQDSSSASPPIQKAAAKTNGQKRASTATNDDSHKPKKVKRENGVKPKTNGHAPDPDPEKDDARLAAMLQAQEDSGARPTRGGDRRKKAAVVRKAKGAKGGANGGGKVKRKSSKRVAASDDSEVEGGSGSEQVVEKEKKGGFHKQFHLSEPLAELCGVTQLSRPQTVKKIWEHIKANDLQDPNDKRNILCDAKMQAVFKSDKVHMFTMNKLLGKHIFPVEEE